MSLEIRMIDTDGKPVPTIEDVAVPTLPYVFQPDSIVLADYCFNDSGPWLKPEQLLRREDVAVVVYGKRGQVEAMFVGDKRIYDEEVMTSTLRCLHETVLTKYQGKEGKEIFLFFLSPKIKVRLRECRTR